MVLRLLALHGFGQNAAVFMEKRAKELIRKLKAVAILHAIEAPHTLPYDDSLRGWWIYSKDLWDGRGDSIQALAEQLMQLPDFEALGLAESLELLLAEWSSGGYDGILGFSQGAILAAALCAELHRRGQAPRFAIFISGFGKPVPLGLDVFPPPTLLPVPSLHVWGQGDDHIPPWASEVLAKYFVEPKIHAHPGGHFIPQKAADLNVIVDFVTAAGGAETTGGASKPPGGKAPKPTGSTPTSGCADASPKQAAPVPGRHGIASPSDELAGPLRAYASRGTVPKTTTGATLTIKKTTTTTSEPAAASTAFLPEELEPPGTGTYERVLKLLKESGVDFSELGPHAPCRTSEDSVRVRLAGGWTGVTLHSGAKAMLLRTAKGSWLLAVLPADCKLSWKKVRALHGKGTRMATEEEVRDATGCVPGAVPPFAAAFPAEVAAIVDETLPEVINFNCGLRTRSIQLRRASYEMVQKPSFADIIE